ncbi:hypothetical protein J7J13_02685 [bacterium]|nr:hypothetical protein [bacterium]
MSKITKKVFCVYFSVVIVLLTMVAAAGAKERNGNCAVLVSDNNSTTIHLDSLYAEGNYYEVNFRLAPNPPGEDGLFFELCPDYRYSEQADDNCSVWDPNTLTVHISSLLSGEVCYWADLLWREDLWLFQLTDWCHHGLDIFGLAHNVIDGFGDWRENLKETSQFSNLAMIASDGESVASIAFGDAQKIKKAAELGMKSLIVITNILFVTDFDESGTLKDVRLRDGYRQRLAEYKFWLHICGVKPGDIWGFYILDEPYWAAIVTGMPIGEMRQMLNEAIAVLKEVFPASKTAGVIAVTKEDLEQESVFGFPIPENAAEEYGMPNFDIVGFDLYWSQFHIYNYEQTLQAFFEVWKMYMENLTEFLLPGQKIVLVPGTFYFSGSPISTGDFLDLAKFYWDTAKSDPRVVAVVPFLWPSSGDLIGLRDLSPKVREAWREIGTKIKNNN